MDVEPQLRRHTGTASFGQRPARQSWSPRARRLIEASCALCADWLGAPLKHCLDAFDQNLYQQAERSRNHLEQQRCFDSRALLDRERATFAQRFIDDLSDGFARLDESETPPADDAPLQPLSLLDRNEHELNTALDKLAARGEARHSLPLSELGYRFAVLVAMPPLEGAALPPGPANLARALRTASEPMQLPIEHRLLLLRAFEQTVTAMLGKLYDAINAHLLDDGILPQLRTFSAARPGTSHSGGNRLGAASDDPLERGNEAPAATPATAAGAAGNEPIAVLETLRDLLARGRHRGGDAATPDAARAATADELQTALGALQQHLVQVTDKASRELRSAQRLREELLLQLNAGKPADAEPTQLSAEQDDTVELVAMLFEQLGQQLHQGPHARALLGDLQLPMLRLAVTDHDFFDQREHPGRRLLGTVAEAANDWLDSPDGETDGPLLARLEQLVERARREPPSAGLYTTLLADIEHHLAQLNRKAQTTERRHIEAMQGREKLDQARHRATELMNERFARTNPRGLLRALLERAWSDVLALTLLRHGEDSETFAWRLRITDQLLGQLPVDDPTRLRQEVEAGLQQIGMHVEEAEQVAQRLIGTSVPAPAATAPRADAVLPTPDSAAPAPVTAARTAATRAVPKKAPTVASSAAAPAVTTPPATALPAAAVAKPAAAPMAQAASTTPRPTLAATADHLPSATDLALRLKQRQRLGEQRSQESRRNNDPGEQPPLGPQEARIHNRLRQLPFGSWFEFADPAGGAPTALKLAWFSPISGNSLFVTRRGQRGEEMNLRELARAMASGRVRELPPQRDGLLDRAWHALTSNLLRPARAVPPTRFGVRP